MTQKFNGQCFRDLRDETSKLNVTNKLKKYIYTSVTIFIPIPQYFGQSLIDPFIDDNNDFKINVLNHLYRYSLCLLKHLYFFIVKLHIILALLL